MDCTAYFERIGLSSGDEKPSLQLLNRIIYAHQCSIPFEDIDVYDLHKAISLDHADLFAKIVERKRGGYCFELNTLFCALLNELGFDAWGCRFVVPDGDGPLDDINHRGTIVRLDERLYFADVGFGGPMPPFAVPIDAAPHTKQGETYWTEASPHAEGWLILKRLRGRGILDTTRTRQDEALVGYFEPTPMPDQYFLKPNARMSEGDEAPFRNERLVNLRTVGGYRAIVNDNYLEVEGGRRTSMPVGDALQELLAEKFGIVVDLRVGQITRPRPTE